MSSNDLEMSNLVSAFVDEDPPRSEEAEVMSQNVDASTHHMNRPSIDGLKTPSSRTLSNSEQPKKIVIIIAIILSVSIAPLSAIAIIPRAGLWQILKPVGLGNETIYYCAKPLRESNFWETNFDTEADSQHSSVYNGSKEILEKLRPVISKPPTTNNLTNTRQITNISYSGENDEFVSLTMDFLQLNRINMSSVTIATCPMDGVVRTIDVPWGGKIIDKDFLTMSRQKSLDRTSGRWNPGNESTRAAWWKKFHAAPTSRWKQPIVLAECADNHTVGDALTFQFSTGISDNEVILSGRYDNDFKRFLRDARHEKGVQPDVRHLILDSSSSSGSPPSASILFLTSLPPYINGTLIDGQAEDTIGLGLCRIYSRWVEADIWLEQSKPSAQTHLDSPLSDMEAHSGDTQPSGSPIEFSKEWLSTMSPEVGEPAASNNSYQAILDVCTGIPMSSYEIYNEAGGDTEIPPTSEDIIVHLEYFINGYGYSWYSSRTILLAFSVLLLHVLIVLVHVVSVLWSRHPWYSSSWSSFGQMMVLALRSKAPEGLGSVGTGVSSSETWNKSVSVRVVDAEDRLEMILQDEKGVVSQNQQVNSGAEEAGRDTGLSFARSGVKYH
ncbi:uncharacterized protein FIESC28_06678 [Fusarium coffeatum]|uniref:Uncharacterized protein n=1 Tax=Fusarium coffeatum TaxID=231269 RepID=A0A366RL86_9HYPO|nr:uncharacterized protein FIESC28_06678 [Fusarium coffeatum]RBR17176.1 hypothetical protein FIESC28_06678 [Fusarium coffeatum]